MNQPTTPPEVPPSSPSDQTPPTPIKRLLLCLSLGTVLAALSLTLTGSLILGFILDNTRHSNLYVAGGLALLFTAVLPIAAGLKLAGSPLNGVRVFTAWNLLACAVPLLLAPAASKKALWTFGSWPVDLVAPSSSEHAGAYIKKLATLLPGPTPAGKLPAAPPPASSAASANAKAPAPTASSQPPPSAAAQRVYNSAVSSVACIGVRKPLTEGIASRIAKHFGLKQLEGFGSGFFVSADGLMITNHHVIAKASSAQVRLKDGRRFNHVTLLADDPSNDLALIQVKTTGAHPLTLATGKVPPGIEAFAIGNPVGLEFTITRGIVSAVRDWQGTRMLQMQTAIAPGSSGGPLLNADAQLLGVNTASAAAGMNLAVHVRHVRDLLKLARTPKHLDTWVPGFEIASLSFEGHPMPSERANLRASAKSLGARLTGCFKDHALPPDANIRVELTRKVFTRMTLHSNFDKTYTECTKRNLKLMSQVMAFSLGDNKNLTSMTITFHAPVNTDEPTAHAPASPSSGPPPVASANPKPLAGSTLKITLRFVDTLPQQEGDSGNDDELPIGMKGVPAQRHDGGTWGASDEELRKQLAEQLKKARAAEAKKHRK